MAAAGIKRTSFASRQTVMRAAKKVIIIIIVVVVVTNGYLAFQQLRQLLAMRIHPSPD